MPGRYVVLEFRSDEVAEEWLKRQHRTLVDDDGVIIGVYYKPTFFCKCSDKTKQTAGNWARARRYGIFICRNCRRPSIFHERGLAQRLEYAIGRNLWDGA